MVLELEEILGLDGDHCPFAGLRPFFTCKRGRKDMFIAHWDRSIACMKLHLVREVPHRVVLGKVGLGVVVPISKVAVPTLGAVVDHVGVAEVTILADEVALGVGSLRLLLVGHEVEVVVPEVLVIRVLELGGVVIAQILSNGITMRNDT